MTQRQKKHYLWTEKYRPSSIDDYVFRDPGLRKTVEKWVRIEKDIPHLLLHGPAGTGKSSLINVLVNELEIQDGDVLYINVPDESGIDIIRDKILRFVQLVGFGKIKVVILEEADRMTASAMPVLKRVMEDYAHICRFLITTNHIERIISPILSRVQEIELSKHDENDFRLRLAEILLDEGVSLEEEDLEVLDSYIRATYPDLRKAINVIQKNVHDGILSPPGADDERSASEDMFKIIELFKNKKILEARDLVCKTLNTSDYDDMFRLMYNNINLFTDDVDLQCEVIKVIRNGLVNHEIVGDKEINLAAVFSELYLISEGSS